MLYLESLFIIFLHEQFADDIFFFTHSGLLQCIPKDVFADRPACFGFFFLRLTYAPGTLMVRSLDISAYYGLALGLL